MRSLSPSGSTVLVADAEGNPVARSRYDPFGGVVATQLWSGGGWGDSTPQPLAQTDRLYLGDLLERNLNLYFTAGGRYYDPWLGKHLQPDPTGGPPLLPQAADRYQYAGNSPTGVARDRGPSEFEQWAVQQAIKVPAGGGWERLYARAVGAAVLCVSRPTGYAQVTIRAEKRLISSIFDDLPVTSRQRPRLLSWKGLKSLFTDAYDIETRSGRMLVSDISGLSLADAAHLNLQVERETIPGVALNWKGVVAELGMAAAIDVAFQVAQDWSNPYLTSEQRAYRAGAAGASGLASGGTGLAVEAGLVYVGVASGPAGWAAIVVAVGVDLTWNFWITPIIYEWVGLYEGLHLRPLGESMP